jgi:hypothetical protein
MPYGDLLTGSLRQTFCDYSDFDKFNLIVADKAHFCNL